MEKKQTSVLVAILLLYTVFSSCNNDTKNKGMIVVDPDTGKQYLLIRNFNDTYFKYERLPKVVGTDTTWVFN